MSRPHMIPILLHPHHHQEEDAVEVESLRNGRRFIMVYRARERKIEISPVVDGENRIGPVVGSETEPLECLCKNIYEHFVGIYTSSIAGTEELTFIQWVSPDNGTPLRTQVD